MATELVRPGVYLKEVVNVSGPVFITARELMNEVSGILFAYDPMLKSVCRLGQAA
jgi:hypothetical protein